MENHFRYFKRPVVLMILVVFLAAGSILLFASDDQGKSVDEILAEIRSVLNLGANQKIDPDRVPENLLEELGEALMSARFSDERTHEWMDNMMGGEESESLKSAHRLIGYRYLDYLAGDADTRFWNRRPMMWDNYGRRPGGFGIGSIILGIILLAVLGITIYFIIAGFRNNIGFSRDNGTNNSETAMDILKKRYVLGEISKEEFEEKKKMIQ